ncbi:MAG: hypothetical protein ACPGRE_03360 [Flavobacteriaceae bacterium]
MDQLDNYFKNTKEEFNTELPNLNHEDRFLAKLQKQNERSARKSPKGKWWIPLAACFALGVSFYLGTTLNQEDKTPGRSLAEISPQMQETQFFYTSLIQKEKRQIQAYNSESNENQIKSSFTQLEKLEEDYKQLELNLDLAPQNKQIVAAMIQNYQLRVRVLQELLNRLEQNKKLEYENFGI